MSGDASRRPEPRSPEPPLDGHPSGDASGRPNPRPPAPDRLASAVSNRPTSNRPTPDRLASAAPSRPTPDRLAPVAPDRLAPDVRALVDLLTGYFPDLGGTVTDAVEARRVLAAAPASPFEPPAVGLVVDRDVPGPPDAPPLPVRIYLPAPEAVPGAEAASRPTVVFLHGGGWVIGSPDTHDATARYLCRDARAAVVSVDYRLAPEWPFPAAVEDAYAALRWAAAHRGELGGEQGALVVAGDSAGGNLAAVSCAVARERGGPRVDRQVLVYPACDAGRVHPSHHRNGRGYFLTAAHCEWFLRQYLGGGGDPRDPRVSPLRGDVAGLPPAHIVTAGCDPLCDEGRAYAERLRGAGVAVTESHFPGMFHGFLGFPELLADARTALEGVTRAIVSTVP